MRTLAAAIVAALVLSPLSACTPAAQDGDVIDLTPSDNKADGTSSAEVLFDDASDGITLVARCREHFSCDATLELFAADEDIIAHAQAYFAANPGETSYEVVLATATSTVDGTPGPTATFHARASRSGDEIKVEAVDVRYGGTDREHLRIKDVYRKAMLTFHVTPAAEAFAQGWQPMVLTAQVKWW